MKNCNLCDKNSLEIVYTPSNSEIDLQIGVCKFCGLVQGVYDSETYERINDAVHDPASKVTRLNCDAAYSDIRVGKQQMLSNAIKLISENNITDNIDRVLDIRAARGDFVNYFHSLMPGVKIDAIETDQYMADQIHKVSNINVISSKYKDWSPTYNYNLIYSCHTLEHYRDPKGNLKYIRHHLDDDGYLILDVPNIDIISKTSNFDEYFYDKHLSYFSKATLEKMMTLVGFETIVINDDGPCLYGLFKKADVMTEPEVDHDAPRYGIKLMKSYEKEINLNRASVNLICNNINKFVGNNGEGICFWGIGRLYDVFKTYGHLNTPEETLLVDNYLSKATSELYGRPIHDQRAITDGVQKVILFTRTSRLKEELSKDYRSLDIYHWSDFQ
jgi:hypothetical protein